MKLEEMNLEGNSERSKNLLIEEIINQKSYEKFFSVPQHSIVVDVGANVGFFPFTLQNKNVQHYYGIEPSITIAKSLETNLSKMGIPHTVFNCAMTEKDGMCAKDPSKGTGFIYGHEYDYCFGLTWDTFIRACDIDFIHYLKVDCEGGEYNIFTEENHHFLTRNVRYIVGEWHLYGDNSFLRKWYKFYDLYLKNHDNYKIIEPMYWNWYDKTETIKKDPTWPTKYYNWWAARGDAPNFFIYIDNYKTYGR